ncbi:MAG: PAS domain S-box protein [Acidobacteriota bacterium]|nr:PAS domain S-box protein [Acidobacteriota bacterium]
MTLTLSRQNLKRWIADAIATFHTQDLLGVPKPWLEIYESLAVYISEKLEVDEKLLWMIEATDDALPDTIYLLQRLKNALVAELVKEDAGDEITAVLSWFDRAIVVLAEKYSGKASRERTLSKPFETIFWNARDGMYISTIEGRFVHGNEALVQMLDFDSLEELLAMDISNELYVNENERRIMLDHLKQDGFFDHHEFDFRTNRGVVRTAMESCYMVDIPGGKRYIVGIMVDITEEKESLRKTEEYVRTIEKSGMDTLLELRRKTRGMEALMTLNDHPVLLVDVQDFHIIQVNQAFKKRFKTSRTKKAEHMNFRDLFSPDEWMKVFSQASNIVQRHHFHIRNLKMMEPDHDEFYTDLTILVHQEDKGVTLFVQIEERTALRSLETQLQQSRHNLEGVFEGLPVGVIGFRNDGSVVMINRFFHDFIGYGSRQLKNLSFINRLFARDEQRLKFHKYVRQFLRGRHVQNQPVELKARSGEILNFRLDTISYQFEGDDKPGFLALLTNVTDQVVLEKLLKKNEQNPGSLDKAYTDMERRYLDLESRMTALLRKNRFLGEFAKNLTGKFKVPIHLVLGYASLLKLDLVGPANDGRQEDISIIEDHIRFLLNMLEKAAEYAELEANEIQASPAEQNVRTMIDQLFERLKPKVLPTEVTFSAERLILSLDLKINCDLQLLEAILRHIIDNASAYTRKGAISMTAYEEQRRLWIEVEDSGIGIGPTDLPQVFEPFFQVVREGDVEQRLGLGLAIARKYADLAGYSLEIHSKLGSGTKVLLGVGRVKTD